MYSQNSFEKIGEIKCFYICKIIDKHNIKIKFNIINSAPPPQH